VTLDHQVLPASLASLASMETPANRVSLDSLDCGASVDNLVILVVQAALEQVVLKDESDLLDQLA